MHATTTYSLQLYTTLYYSLPLSTMIYYSLQFSTILYYSRSTTISTAGGLGKQCWWGPCMPLLYTILYYSLVLSLPLLLLLPVAMASNVGGVHACHYYLYYSLQLYATLYYSLLLSTTIYYSLLLLLLVDMASNAGGVRACHYSLQVFTILYYSRGHYYCYC